MRMLAVEWLKTKRTPMRWVVFLPPLLFSLFLTWYFSHQGITVEHQSKIYETFFVVWTTLIMPIGAGLISGLLIHQEEMAGRFNGFLGSKLSRIELFNGKLLMLVFMSAVSTILATLTFVLGLRAIAHIPVSWEIFGLSAIIAVVCTIPLLIFHLWLSFAWGMGASIGVGGVGILLASLMSTTLGNEIWHFVPWGWAVRLSVLLGVTLPDVTLPSSMEASSYIMHGFLKGGIPAILFFLVMFIGGNLWFNKWEGPKNYD